MSTHFECDCGAVYSHHDLMIACATRNHGNLDKRRLCGLRLPGEERKHLSQQRFCMLFTNHRGDCSASNPELSRLQG